MTHHVHQQGGQSTQQTRQAGGSQGTSGGQQTGGGLQTSSGQGMESAQQMGGGQQTGMRLQDVQSPEERAVLDAVVHSVEVCGFCADRCIQEADPHMIECVRLCEDVVELGETVLALLPRQSRHAQPVLQTFQQAAQACAQECAQHQHAHCQDCAQALGRATSAIQRYLGQGGQGMGQQMGQQPSGGQQGQGGMGMQMGGSQ